MGLKLAEALFMGHHLLHGNSWKIFARHGKFCPMQNKEDWDFFAQVFFVKEYSLFEYQARILLDESIKVAKWTEDEDYMLYCIIVKDKNAKWNEIAKSLFVTSNKQYLRASKQCRERWLNHLDPSKSKS